MSILNIYLIFNYFLNVRRSTNSGMITIPPHIKSDANNSNIEIGINPINDSVSSNKNVDSLADTRDRIRKDSMSSNLSQYNKDNTNGVNSQVNKFNNEEPDKSTSDNENIASVFPNSNNEKKIEGSNMESYNQLTGNSKCEGMESMGINGPYDRSKINFINRYKVYNDAFMKNYEDKLRQHNKRLQEHNKKLTDSWKHKL